MLKLICFKKVVFRNVLIIVKHIFYNFGLLLRPLKTSLLSEAMSEEKVLEWILFDYSYLEMSSSTLKIPQGGMSCFVVAACYLISKSLFF